MKQKFDPIAGRNAEIIEAVLGSAEVADLSEDFKFKIRLCVEEVEENILAYSGSTWIEVWTEREADLLTVGFRDGGIQFDPLAAPDPDINAPLEKRAIGGLGIFICKKMMDTVDYHFENKCNVFVMKLKVSE